MSRYRAKKVGAVVLLLVAAGAGAGNLGARHGDPPAPAPTRADLDGLRRKVARLECELALGRSRKPYLVLDAARRQLRVALMGMTVREIPLESVELSGLVRADRAGAPAPPALAGVTTLSEKEADPRLKPLTPSDVEAGAADENVADVLPPEAPAVYGLRFKQKALARVEGTADKSTTGWSRLATWWRQLWPGAVAGSGGVALGAIVRLDATVAREIWRSILPGEHLLFVPPNGFLLPDLGQESPRDIKPPKTAPPPGATQAPPAQGVPFRIPPPLEPPSGNGTEGEAPAGAETPAPGVGPGDETGSGPGEPSPGEGTPEPPPPPSGA